MNIFALSDDPEKAAKWHMCRHITKMPLEYAQLLSTASRLSGLPQGYRSTHIQHPSTLWTADSLDNWLWVRELALELGDRFKQEHGREHKSTRVVKSLKKPLHLPRRALTPVRLAMYDWLRNKSWNSHVEAYRTFYRSCKLHIADWPSERYVPPWWDVSKHFVVPPAAGKPKLLSDMHKHHGTTGVRWLKNQWARVS